MTKASDYYSDVAKQYDKTVFAKIQKELVASLLTLLFSCFDSQLKMLRQTTYSKVENEVKKLERKELDEICDNLSEILQALLDQSTKSFALKSDSLILEGSGWHSKVDAHKVDLQSNLLTLVNNCKSKLLDKLSQTA